MLEITSHRQGAILNHLHGIESADKLKILVQGISRTGRPVKVNGINAEMDGRLFSAEIALTQKFNQLECSVLTPYGLFTQQLTVVWDKKSFRRCNFYIDDHIFVFTDLAKQKPRSAFDHFYFNSLKKTHAETGIKFSLNIFYRNDHHPFELKDMPDTWKQEFIDNSDWLRFSFHSYSEFPDRPYLETTVEEFSRDYDLVQNEIIRFAGEESFIPPVVLHWGNIHPVAAEELVKRGTRCYAKAFRPAVMGGPSLAERQGGGDMQQVEARYRKGSERGTAPTEGLDLHYNFPEEKSYFQNHKAYYDPNIGLFFAGGSGCCCNLVPLEDIKGRYAKIAETAEKYGVELFSGGSHEQYSFSYYPNYQPDHMERIACAARCLVKDLNCKPVFFNEGLLGNMAWEK